MNNEPKFILNRIVFACSRGTYLFSERPQLEGVNAALCAEVDISVGVADVLVYADDIGIFEIGTTRPTKMLLLLKHIARLDSPFTLHFWPYGTSDAFIFRNWK